MKYTDNRAEDVVIAYIGGGSRGWGWTLMNDLAKTDDMSGEVRLYDIDFPAAYNNEIIGNKVSPDRWKYRAVRTIGEALTGADFVVISILPGTFDEMESDVHAPEKYGVYQSVGDTTGPGGLVRAMRTIPMIEYIAHAIEKYSPSAWVINYTNPMAVCIGTLYKAFPQIKAFGCCHEVFSTQKLLVLAAEEILGLHDLKRSDIDINVVGCNHFTWFTSARYRNYDLFPVYRDFVGKYYESGYTEGNRGNWMNDYFKCCERVKFDLFLRFGYIAAAGDRHLAEFMNREDYLESPEKVKKWMFGLTPVSWRKNDLLRRLDKSKRLLDGSEIFRIRDTGEEGVLQMKALLGLSEMVTNINIPNAGQIPNLPYGSIVETNALLRSDGVTPLMADNVPESIFPYVSRIVKENDDTVIAGFERSYELAYKVFSDGHLLRGLDEDDKYKLFTEMCGNTAKYLTEYK